MTPRILLLAALACALLLAACGEASQSETTTAQAPSLAGELGAEADAGFARADHPRRFHFPFDHGPHPAYRNEWWYFTGNLRDDDNHRYGFELTVFRIGLAATKPASRSAWATRSLWMAHLAVTDAHGQGFHSTERFARGGDMGLAGARRGPVRIWLEDWRIRRAPGGDWQLRAAADGFGLKLRLTPRKAPVLQGDAGLSQKSPAAGNASYYYSVPRLSVRGSLRLDGVSRRMTGRAWLDREWSTSALGPDLVGWDWFALQLDDGTDIMVYRLRRADGSTDALSAGSISGPRGRVRPLQAKDFALTPQAHWTSPAGGVYPVAWRLRIAGFKQALQVEPVLPAQELDTTLRYWEGAVNVLRAGRRIGVGYLELTGYAEH